MAKSDPVLDAVVVAQAAARFRRFVAEDAPDVVLDTALNALTNALRGYAPPGGENHLALLILNIQNAENALRPGACTGPTPNTVEELLSRGGGV